MSDGVMKMNQEAIMLKCQGIKMSFGGVAVLKGIDLELEQGTVTALAGENGAGKSTLMKIFSGQYRPDAGTVFVRGEKLLAGNSKSAAGLGVAIVPQELASIPELKVYENLFVGREIHTYLGTLNRRVMIKKASEDLANFGLDLDPTLKMGNLSVGVRQIIEILKATSRGARVILLDEPTSAVAEREVDHLIEVVRNLRDQGVGVLFTTHKMEEIRAMANRVVILRDGNLVEDKPLTEITDDEIVTSMIGRKLEALFPKVSEHHEDVILEVKNLVIKEGNKPINFKVRAGEILGLAGLVGAGRSELIECLYGIRKPFSGEVKVFGKALKTGSPLDAINKNCAIIPEDRKGAGSVLSMSILDNATLPRISNFSNGGLIKQRKRKVSIEKAMASVNLKSKGLSQTMQNLSGGNQQKVVFGRWLTNKVDVLFLDEPTRGVDIGARSEIYRIITDLANRGMAVLMASSDMPEILSLTHRVLVMRDFGVIGSLTKEELKHPQIQDTIFRLASGQEITRHNG